MVAKRLMRKRNSGECYLVAGDGGKTVRVVARVQGLADGLKTARNLCAEGKELEANETHGFGVIRSLCEPFRVDVRSTPRPPIIRTQIVPIVIGAAKPTLEKRK